MTHLSLNPKVNGTVLPLNFVSLRLDTDDGQTFHVWLLGEAPVSEALQVVNDLVSEDGFKFIMSKVRRYPELVRHIEVEEPVRDTFRVWSVWAFYDVDLAGGEKDDLRRYAGHLEITQTYYPIQNGVH